MLFPNLPLYHETDSKGRPPQDAQSSAAAAAPVSDPRELEERRRAFSVSDGSRPFLAAVFDAMDCAENDYLALFALCLIHAMQQNTGERVIPQSHAGLTCCKTNAQVQVFSPN